MRPQRLKATTIAKSVRSIAAAPSEGLMHLIGDLSRFKNSSTIFVLVAVGNGTVDCAMIPRMDREPIITVTLDPVEKAIGGPLRDPGGASKANGDGTA